MNRTKILVVDDHGIMRDSIRALLDLRGDIEVVGEAADGREAVGKAMDLKPEVILMDIVMPGMDGLEATRRIKKQMPDTKVIVLSQYDDKEYVLSAVKAGADGYVPKRAASMELSSAITTVSKGDAFLDPVAAEAVMRDYQRVDRATPYDSLTPREREIMKLITEGYTSRKIAEMLSLSLKTVQVHRGKIMKKLDLHRYSDLIKYAVRKGLSNTDPIPAR